MSAAGAEALAGARPPLSQAGTADAEVYTGLRLVRTLAMLSIVAFHIDHEPLFGIAFGLTSLQVVMCALATRRSRAPRFAAFARKRAKRLLAPWVFWSALYLLFELVRALRWGDGFASHLKPWMWGSGGAYHLWFLPFAFVASLVVVGVKRLVQNAPKRGSVLFFAALGAVLVLASAPLQSALQPAVPFDCWIDGLPTLAFGLALGTALSIDEVRERHLGIFCIALVGALPILLNGALDGVFPASAVLAERYGIGVPFVCLGLMVQIPKSRTLAALASVNMGVYLVHVFAIGAVLRLQHSPVIAALPPLLLVYVLCLAAVFGLRRLRIPHAV
jgi:peptidoglycan/LPS O-acetylase OafA/YrhL